MTKKEICNLQSRCTFSWVGWAGRFLNTSPLALRHMKFAWEDGIAEIFFSLCRWISPDPCRGFSFPPLQGFPTSSFSKEKISGSRLPQNVLFTISFDLQKSSPTTRHVLQILVCFGVTKQTTPTNRYGTNIQPKCNVLVVTLQRRWCKNDIIKSYMGFFSNEFTSWFKTKNWGNRAGFHIILSADLPLAVWCISRRRWSIGGPLFSGEQH